MKAARLALLLALLAAFSAAAQIQPVLCNKQTNTACTPQSGPPNTGVGDYFWTAFGKLNANETQLFGMFGASGILRGNGAVPDALSPATYADINSLFGNAPLHITNQATYGQTYTAVGSSTVTNSTHAPQVMGWVTDSGQANYATRDSVGSYWDNTCPAPIASGVAGTFTTTTFTPSGAFSAPQVALFHVGMYVITQESSTFYSGTVSGWDPGGAFLTVLAWYQQGNTASGQQPPNSDTLTVNPATKCWAGNSVLTMPSTSIAKLGTIHEFDLNDLTATASTNADVGLDVVNLNSTGGNSNAFQARGVWGNGFITFQTTGQGFNCGGTLTAGYCFHSQNFDVVGTTGQVDVGSLIATQTNATIQLHDSGHATGDVTIASSAGTGANDGILTLTAGQIAWNGKATVFAAAPTIVSGFGTSPSIADNNGPASFTVTVGTGASASNGVVGLPATAHGWSCSVSDNTTITDSTAQTANSASSVTVTNFGRTTGTATAWAAGDSLRFACWPD